MVDFEDEKDIKESYEEYERIREQQTKATPKNILQNIPRGVLIGVFLAALVLFYLVFVSKALESNAFLYFLVIAVIFIILMSVQEDGDTRKLIPEKQLKSVLYTKLKEKQRMSPTEVPMGEINILLASKLKKIEGIPVKYVFSFKIVTPSGLEKYYTAEMNPYDGYILGFEERPAGFRGTEVSDVAFIRRREDVWEEKYFKGRKK